MPQKLETIRPELRALIAAMEKKMREFRIGDVVRRSKEYQTKYSQSTRDEFNLNADLVVLEIADGYIYHDNYCVGSVWSHKSYLKLVRRAR